MRKYVRTCLLIVGATLLVAGCSKQAWEGLFSRRDGAPVVFSMTTRSDTPTRTVYGDFSDNTKTFQYIDWVAGDVIRIYSPDAVNRADFGSDVADNQKRHWSDYRVTGQQRRAVNGVSKSVATIENVNSNGLAWKKGESASSHQFFGLYPAPYDEDEGLIQEDSQPAGMNGVISLEMPAYQDYEPAGDMSLAYMTATAVELATGDDAGKVELEFLPAYTAFEIELKSAEGAGEVVMDSFRLVSEAEALSGDFAITYNGTTRTASCPEPVDAAEATPDTPAVEGNKSIIVTFPSGTTIDEDSAIRFTIFALPQDFSKLKLVFVVNNNGTFVPRTLKLKYASTAVDHTPGEWIPFAGFKKHRILGLALPGGGWSVSLTLVMDDDQLKWLDGIYDNMKSEEYPMSSQFTVTNAINKRDGGIDDSVTPNVTVAGNNVKADRQTWYFKQNGAIRIDFNVTSPTGGTWSIVPQGDTDSFDVTCSYTKYTTTTVDGNTTTTGTVQTGLTGTVNDGRPTNITLTVTPKAGAQSGKQIYFKTYVTNADGTITYSLDSETQLFDMRGYHYLVIR